MIIPIADPDDPRIEPYRAIRERDLVGREGRFMAEGEVVLRVLATRSHHVVESLFLAQGKVAPLSDLIGALPESIPVHVAPPQVMETIVGFPIHRGILALGRRAPPMDVRGALRAASLVVCLVGLANHDNVGGIFRNAAAFGADLILIDEATCDPLYRKAIRVSVGGSLVVPFARLGTADMMMDLLEEAGFHIIALSPSGRETLSSLQAEGRTALLLGAEGPGLPERVLRRARSVSIPMSGGFDSLNVATTSGIALHHLAVARAG